MRPMEGLRGVRSLFPRWCDLQGNAAEVRRTCMCALSVTHPVKRSPEARHSEDGPLRDVARDLGRGSRTRIPEPFVLRPCAVVSPL